MMKRIMMLTLLALMLLGAGACSSIKPLKMRYYRKNIVVKADESIWANDIQVKLADLRSGLVAQLIFDETPIVVHFHKDLSRESFDRIMSKLKSEGYKNYDCVVYRD
jgi:biopolymer transport protein ExbD